MSVYQIGIGAQTWYIGLCQIGSKFLYRYTYITVIQLLYEIHIFKIFVQPATYIHIILHTCYLVLPAH